MTNWRPIGGLLAVLLCSACSATGNASISTKIEGGEVQVTVRHIRDAEDLHIRGVAVYGDVVVKSDRRLRSVDLGCVRLLTHGTRSSKPYVDSAAYVMTNNYAAGKDGIVRAKLYWVFLRRDITEVKPKSLMLTVDQSGGPCFKWEI